MIEIFELENRGARALASAATWADASAALPHGPYSTLLVRKGLRVLDFDHHLDRLVDPSGAARPDLPKVAGRLLGALEMAGLEVARVRLTRAGSRLFASLAPFEPLPAALYARGVACQTVVLQRGSPTQKDTRFLVAADAARSRFGSDVHEGLMTSAEGALLEGLSSNFFAVHAGELWTAGEGVLPGVTRRRLLGLAAHHLPIRLEPIGPGALSGPGEAFLTSASRGVLPVVGIDGVPVGDGIPGPMTRRLGALLEAAEVREAVALAELASSERVDESRT